MSGLSFAVLTDDAERLRGALTLAMAHMALGGEARVFLQLDAVRLLAPPISAPRDGDHAAHGLPTLAALVTEALDAGVAIIACQSGLTLAGLAADTLDPRVIGGGPVSLLQSIGPEDRLMIV
ncbi:DsrE family protein [Sphingobium sp. DEHP117]|uniref:DsrE family protein n=1 Tax=Sphingobium sp. DEHP117 TaxID=2993436 RepID=UPI0027D6E103|nr:DsrE family protein [Sphingobium sp. DEHP117]MDQ4420614.1 DsrE family protein [Sphingobium sp. DEHP117]